MNAAAIAIRPACGHVPQAPLGAEGPANAAIRLADLRTHVRVLQRQLEAGQHLYRAGQSFHSLYLVNSGVVKTCLIDEEGREQVTGFRMRGDLIGVESIGMPAHSCDAIALDTCGIWELPYPEILMACARMPELQTQLTAALAAEIRSDRSWMLTIGKLSAEQRVAAFLLDLAARHEAVGFPAGHFVLRMSRADIGSYLALKHETVTRALTRLTKQGCIAIQWREVRILDSAALRATIHNDPRLH
jgi:CRP/FNR family transcriptional regulator